MWRDEEDSWAASEHRSEPEEAGTWSRDDLCQSVLEGAEGGQTPLSRLQDQGPDVLLQILNQHRLTLKSRCEHVTEGVDQSGGETQLSRVFIQLHVTEKETSTQHSDEIHRDTTIKVCDIFKDRHRRIRLVLTVGVAGVGKTFLVQKFTLDWAEHLENQDVDMLMVLSFRELNLIREERLSLLNLIHLLHPSLRKVSVQDLVFLRLLFILDGLDESRLTLDFQDKELVFDVSQSSSLDVLLKNLIQGNLLPSALVWITSRPPAAEQIPPSYISRNTEVSGFTDSQKEEYFRRRFSDVELCRKILSHVQSSRSLHAMCRIPIFCWISATVLENVLSDGEENKLPQTLTNMYSHFLRVQMRRKHQKYWEEHHELLTEGDQKLLLNLGRLAFQHLDNGNLLFYQEDLEFCGLDLTEASVNSGICTRIFKEECVIFQKPVYCFVHLSVQEFLAAVYASHCHSNRNTPLLTAFLRRTWTQVLSNPKVLLEKVSSMFENHSISSLEDFLMRALEKSLHNKSGDLDLFVRFLHGLTVESNRKLLGKLLGPVQNSPTVLQRIVKNLKELNLSEISPDRSINVFHCLTEMNQVSVQKEVQAFLQSERRTERLSEIHCSGLAFVLQMSAQPWDELDLETFNTSKEGRRRLIPAVRNCRRAVLFECGLTVTLCEVVASALTSDPSYLIDLDLSFNQLREDHMERLCVGLRSPNCHLQSLGLSCCALSMSCVSSLMSALQSNPSHLRHLDVSDNPLQDAGVRVLCGFLHSASCRLETLSLRSCRFSSGACAYLLWALTANSCLLHLDLRQNPLTEPERLLRLLQGKGGHLHSIRVNNRTLEASTDRGCEDEHTQQEESGQCQRKAVEAEEGEEREGTEDVMMTMFTPKVKVESTRLSYRVSLPAEGLFHCRTTGIRFLVDKGAELVYGMVQWDEGLLQSVGKTPVGPLYHITSSENSVCALQLPHCESEAALRDHPLIFAHVTEDGMSLTEPLHVTDTHAMLKVPHLSAFGLLRDAFQRLFRISPPVNGQVLLFLRPPGRGPPVLDVFLLQENVPLPEVAAQQDDAERLKVSANCSLTVGGVYSVTCEPRLQVQPKAAQFRSRFGPNFHPTFEVFLTDSSERLHLRVEDGGGAEVWGRDVYVSGRRSDPWDRSSSLQERMLLSVRTDFVHRVSEAVLNQLLDRLLQQGVVTDEEMQVAVTKSRADRAREVIDRVRLKGGRACAALNRFILEVDPVLHAALGLG